MFKYFFIEGPYLVSRRGGVQRPYSPLAVCTTVLNRSSTPTKIRDNCMYNLPRLVLQLQRERATTVCTTAVLAKQIILHTSRWYRPYRLPWYPYHHLVPFSLTDWGVVLQFLKNQQRRQKAFRVLPIGDVLQIDLSVQLPSPIVSDNEDDAGECWGPIHSPWLGVTKLTMAWGWRTGPSGYIDCRVGTTNLCHSRLYPPVRDYEFDNWSL